MDFFEKHGRTIALGIVAILVIIGIGAFVSGRSAHGEKSSQEKIVAIEKQYGLYKEKLAQDVRLAESKDKKNEETKITFDTEGFKKQLASFLENETDSSAARIVSLYYSKVLSNEKKSAEALAVIQKVKANGKDLTSLLVQKRLADLLSDNGKCDEAITIWDNLIKIKNAEFMASENKILQALCYKEKNELEKAESILTAVASDKTAENIDSAQKAERLLRSIKFDKSSGT